MELGQSEQVARDQAKQIVKELIEQDPTFPPTVEIGGEQVPAEEMKAIALIAYIQRIGIDYFKTEADATATEGDSASGDATDADSTPDDGGAESGTGIENQSTDSDQT